LPAIGSSGGTDPGCRGADSDSFHEQYARAEIKLRAARALVFETLRDAQQTISERAGEIIVGGWL
jgi:hypothetical protein